jgi:hypothetical protein
VLRIFISMILRLSLGIPRTSPCIGSRAQGVCRSLGNERGDQLAKETTSLSRRRIDYDRCPISFAKRHIRAGSFAEWDGRYRSGTTAVTKMFLPDVHAAYRCARKTPTIGVLTQVLTGHGGFAQYLNRFKCRASPSTTMYTSRVVFRTEQ